MLSCAQEKSDWNTDQSVQKKEARVWHLQDTLSSTSEWGADSISQLKIELKNTAGLHLEARSDAAFYLFFEDKLIAKSNEGYLAYSFKNNVRVPIYLSFAEKGQKLTYGIYATKRSDDAIVYSGLNKTERDDKWVSDNILVILLISASLLMVIIKLNYDKRYFSILSINKIFTLRLKEGDQSKSGILDKDNLVFAGLYIFLTAGLLYFLSLGKNTEIVGVQANGMLDFFKLLLVVAIGLLAKIVLISISSNLFGNGKLSAFYVTEMLNINLFFVIILFFSSILVYLFSGAIPALWLSITVYTLLLFYLARFILLYFKILKLSSFTNLYLFSYFCTTEIFPFLIGLKYFIR
jgi:hypothetical protein